MWAAAALALFCVSASWCIWHAEALAYRAAAWTTSAPDVVALLLGWAPAGGLLILLASLLLWRWRRLRRGLSTQRVVDRLGIAVAMIWLGLTAAFTPSRRAQSPGDYEELVAIPGLAFARAAEWSTRGLLVSLVLGVVIVVVWALKIPDNGRADRELAVVVLPWLAIAVSLPPAVVLAGLLIITV